MGATAEHHLPTAGSDAGLCTVEGQLRLIGTRLQEGVILPSDTARLLDFAYAALGLDPTEPRWAGKGGKYLKGYADALSVVRERAVDSIVPC